MSSMLANCRHPGDPNAGPRRRAETHRLVSRSPLPGGVAGYLTTFGPGFCPTTPRDKETWRIGPVSVRRTEWRHHSSVRAIDGQVVVDGPEVDAYELPLRELSAHLATRDERIGRDDRLRRGEVVAAQDVGRPDALFGVDELSAEQNEVLGDK